jgi:hypothetical protein
MKSEKQLDPLKEIEIYKNKSDKLYEIVNRELNKNPNEFLNKFFSEPLDNRYGSGLVPLALAALVTYQGNILELGMGDFSTFLLRRMAQIFNRKLISLETDKVWLAHYASLNSSNLHEIYHVNRSILENYHTNHSNFSLVYVDHGIRELRYKNVIQYANSAQLVLVHDAERLNEKVYKLAANKVRSYFKYACKYSIYRYYYVKRDVYISTYILSNFINMTQIQRVLSHFKTRNKHTVCNENM